MKGRKLKKVLSVCLLVVMFLAAIMPTTVAASGPADGQVESVGGSKTITTDVGYEITMSKTIEAVEGKENYFDITLTASTKQYPKDTSTDVVVVMDISNTMNSSVVGSSTSRITAVKEAVKVFLDDYAANTTLGTKRVGIVTFNTNAKKVLGLTEIANAADAETIKNNYVSSIVAPSEDTVRYTNIEGGLQLAHNILKNSEASYKYVILLTDGFPTTYINNSAGNAQSTEAISGHDTHVGRVYGYGSYDASKNGVDGYFAEIGRVVNGVSKPAVCYYGVDYSDRAAKKAQTVAANIKNDDINVFSIGVALGENSIETYLKKGVGTGDNFSTVDTTGMTDAQRAANQYVIGTSAQTYRTWLERAIAGGPILSDDADVRYLDGDNTAELKENVSKIFQAIEAAPRISMGEFYALDPMGENVEFMHFFDKDGNVVSENQLQGTSGEYAEDTAVYGGEGNEDQINWNLLQSGYTTVDEDGITRYLYEIKYRVRLENEKENFAWSTAYETNKVTPLNYKLVTDTDVIVEDKAVEYLIPQVEGYCGELKFKKIDEDTNKALEGVTFTLKHCADSCSVCEGDATITDFSVVTDSNGYAEIKNIPSGHEYVLTESTPNGYKDAQDWNVIVSYGDTYVGSVSDANKLVDGKFNSTGNEFVITNKKAEPLALQFYAEKTVDGETPEQGAFSFTLTGNTPEEENYCEIAYNDANGTVTFDQMVFDAPGTYQFVVKENVGTDGSIVYDSQEHTVQVEVKQTDDHKTYQAAVSIDDGASVTYVGEENTVKLINAGAFENTTREAVYAELKAAKTLDGKEPKDGQFSFVIQAEEGTPMPETTTVKNDAEGNVSFGPIEYTKEGVYTYTISEVQKLSLGIEFDTTVYTATVTVTAPTDLSDAAENKEYAVSVVYSKDGTEVTPENVVFKNVTKPLVTTVTTTIKTGDQTPILIYAAALVASLVVLGTVIVKRKKVNK